MSTAPSTPDRFRHEALFYSGPSDFVARIVPFIREGLSRHEPVLVVESREKIRLLATALGHEAKAVMFADMAEVGANPARIIPAWQDFVDQHAGAEVLRGIGEPVWAGRPPDELVECQRHEALLNTAFEQGRPWWLLCPYDTTTLPAAVIDEARRSHEFVSRADSVEVSGDFESGRLSRAPLNAPFAEPRQAPVTLAFDRSTLKSVREQTLRVCTSCGLSRRQISDFMAGVNELATNSVLHGGGGGVARIWSEPDRVVCEIRDAGTFDQPLADRRRPEPQASAPRGLWLANQLCDLVQVRSDAEGTTARLHILIDPGGHLRIAPQSSDN